MRDSVKGCKKEKCAAFKKTKAGYVCNRMTAECRNPDRVDNDNAVHAFGDK